MSKITKEDVNKCEDIETLRDMVSDLIDERDEALEELEEKNNLWEFDDKTIASIKNILEDIDEDLNDHINGLGDLREKS